MLLSRRAIELFKKRAEFYANLKPLHAHSEKFTKPAPRQCHQGRFFLSADTADFGQNKGDGAANRLFRSANDS
jgi:hypothetical protein